MMLGFSADACADALLVIDEPRAINAHAAMAPNLGMIVIG